MTATQIASLCFWTGLLLLGTGLVGFPVTAQTSSLPHASPNDGAMLPSSGTAQVSTAARWEGHPTEVLAESWDGATWVNASRFRYSEDGFGTSRTEEIDSWTGTDWRPQIRTVTALNDARQPTQEIVSTNVNGSFVAESRTFYTYSGGVLSSTLRQQWQVHTGWIATSRVDLFYTDGLPTEERRYTYQNANPVPDELVVKDYDDARRILSETTYDWNGSIVQARSATGYDYSTESLLPSSITEQVYVTDDGPDRWENVARTDFTYDAQERRTRVDGFAWGSGAWTQTSRTINAFSGPLMTVSQTDVRVGATWTPQLRLSFSYGVIPVELASFTASRSGASVQLWWTTASETNNAGFDVERCVGPEEPFVALGFVAGRGTTTEATQYRFDDTATTGLYGPVTYRLKQIDVDGAIAYSPRVTVDFGRPGALRFANLGANPMRAATTITYEVPESAPVRLTLYNVLGQQVEVLADEPQAPGVNVALVPADRLPSGLYVLRLESGPSTRTAPIFVVR